MIFLCCDAFSQQDLCLQLQKEKQTHEAHIGELKNSVSELREYVQTLRERERLLVAFPELSPLAKAQPQSRQLFNICLLKYHINHSKTDITQSCVHCFVKHANHAHYWEKQILYPVIC